MLSSKIETRSVTLTDLRRDPALQPRAGLDEATVGEYADALAAGVRLPPVVAYYDGEVTWLADGWHRAAAAERLQRTSIEATVHQGTRRDALLYAIAANAEHGRRRTDADKRRAVEIALSDPALAQLSDREIARQCKVSQPFVSKFRRELSDNGYQIATETRLVERGGTVFEQAVSREARSAARRAEPGPTEADIAIARDLIAEALTTWTRPASLGSIANQVRRLPGGADATKKAIKAALHRMIEAGNVLEVKDAYNRTAYALAHDPAVQVEQPAPASDDSAPLKQRILALIADGPLQLAQIRALLGIPLNDTEGTQAMRAALAELVADKRLRQLRDLYLPPSNAPSTPRAEPEPQPTVDEDNKGDESASDEQQLPTQTAKDAAEIRDLLAKHAPMPLRLRFIREQLDMEESEFYRARMLLEGAGEVKQLGESLHLVAKPPDAPASPPAAVKPARTLGGHLLPDPGAPNTHLQEFLALGEIVATHIEMVLDDDPLPDWLRNSLLPLRQLLYGYAPGDEGLWNPGLVELLRECEQREVVGEERS